MAEPIKPFSIGERILELRSERTPTMTQAHLAERAGVGVELISKLERGAKQTAKLTTLHKIARALDVDVSALLSRPASIEPADDQDGGVLAIRRAITTLWDEGEPASVAELDREARYAWMAFSTNRFDVLASQLPGFITAARATVRAEPSPGAHAALSDAYAVTASMLTLLGHVDLGYLAMERAIAAGDRAEDALVRAALSGRMSWLLLHQTGGADQARRLAVEEADRFEPRLGKALPEQIAIWAGLLVCGAVAAARDGRADEADDMLNLAEAATTRLAVADPDRHGKPAGAIWRDRAVRNEIVHGIPQVIMQQVDVAVVTGRPARALKIAERMPPDNGLPLISRARHMADVAYAQTGLGRDRQATETLLSIEQQAPYWMRYQGYPKTIVRELLERERRANPLLRGLAARLHVA